jgi:hypothetical protein
MKKQPGCSTWQPGCFSETRGFPSLPHDRFGFSKILRQCLNTKEKIQKQRGFLGGKLGMLYTQFTNY